MTKISPQHPLNHSKHSNRNPTMKPKRNRKSLLRDSPPKRSSSFRGVTRHRWTGRYEAHLWDKNCWNESQNKKGRQVYLGAYDDEEAAAHAYDLAALKYWGHDTVLNFPISTYTDELKEMEALSKEEYIGSLRRKSSGFSRGVSKYRGVARHHHNGRWEARISRVFGNKYLYLGTYETQEEAAMAYDMAAIEYRGPNAVTNFDLSRYMSWIKPKYAASDSTNNDTNDKNCMINNNNTNITSTISDDEARTQFMPTEWPSSTIEDANLGSCQQQPQCNHHLTQPRTSPGASSAIGIVLKSSKIKGMIERSSVDCMTTSPRSEELPACSFPDDIQTYFERRSSDSYCDQIDDLHGILGDLNDVGCLDEYDDHWRSYLLL